MMRGTLHVGVVVVRADAGVAVRQHGVGLPGRGDDKQSRAKTWQLVVSVVPGRPGPRSFGR